MIYTAFHEARFHQQVDKALKSVKRILDHSRNPRLPHAYEDDHRYDDKYALAALVTNTSLVAHMNVFEHLGMTADHLETMAAWVHDEKARVTMRFEAIRTCEFVEMKQVKIVADSHEYHTEVEKSGRFFGKNKESTSVKNRVVTKVEEYHWNVKVQHKLIVFKGASPTEADSAPGSSATATTTLTLQSRDAPTRLCICGTKEPPFPNVTKEPPIDVDLTWFLQNISIPKKICTFVIDRSDASACRTPRRNKNINQAVEFFQDLSQFARKLHLFFASRIEKNILGRHAPASPTHQTKWPGTSNDNNNPKHYNKLSSISASNLHCPILPLFEKQEGKSPSTGDGSETTSSLLALSSAEDEDSPILSLGDMDKFLGEQIRTMNEALKLIQDQFLAPDSAPTTGDAGCMISTVEATLYLLALHLEQLSYQYEDSVDYIEDMLKRQLVSAIGKEVQPKDFDEFMSFHYKHKLYDPSFAPGPFCFAIRRPGHYPDGILTIEKGGGNSNMKNKMEPVETFTRRIPVTDETPPIHIPLNAATTVQMTGDRYLHGWIKHRFSGYEPCGAGEEDFRLGARARQFSCFLVMVGTMAGPDQFDPKDAIVLQNKDEVLIPLLLNELPSAKEFKDAIKSLSPEQQQFARSFRGMQLESSVFGVCVVQLKPQLEDLLELPRGALTKEMELTQNLLSLFIEYQIPSDLLSFDGSAEESKAQKIASVKGYTKSVLDVIQGAKDKQLAQEKQKADMAIESLICESKEASLMENLGQAEDDANYEDIALRRAPPAKERHRKHAVKRIFDPAPVAMMMDCAAGGGPGLDFDRGGVMECTFSCSRRVPPADGDQPDCGPGFDFKRGPPVPPGAPPEDHSFFGPGQPEEPDSLNALPREPRPATTTTATGGDNNVGEAVMDFTMIPKQLDAKFEMHDSDNSLRATIIKTQDVWSRSRQENLLTEVCQQTLTADTIKTEKDKAFDLLDALSRSGSLPLAYSELHVVVAVTHCFENDVMGTVIQDNINPIEKVEKSSLMMASIIHGMAPQALLKGAENVARLQGTFPALFDGEA